MCKFKVINSNGKYKDDDARADVIRYIRKRDHAISGLWGGSRVDLHFPIADMEAHAENCGKNKGIRLRHFVLSFSAREVSDPKVAQKIGQQVANYLGRKYQTVFAVHENTDNLHVHLVMNAVGHDGTRYRGTHQEFFSIKNYLRTNLKQYNIWRVQYVYGDDED